MFCAMKEMAMTNLNPKQLAFCREYVVDRNGTQAAIRAGYSGKTANEQAARMLAKVSIKEEIARLEEKHQERCAVSIESLTEEYMTNLRLARELDQVSAANQAIAGVAKLHGLDVTKTDATVRGSLDGKWTVEFVNASPKSE